MRPADPWPFPAGTPRSRCSRSSDHLDAPAASNLPRLLVVFRRAFACKRQGRFAEAAAGFSECLSLHPDDRGAMRQLDACRAAMEQARDLTSRFPLRDCDAAVHH